MYVLLFTLKPVPWGNVTSEPEQLVIDMVPSALLPLFCWPVAAACWLKVFCSFAILAGSVLLLLKSGEVAVVERVRLESVLIAWASVWMFIVALAKTLLNKNSIRTRATSAA